MASAKIDLGLCASGQHANTLHMPSHKHVRSSVVKISVRLDAAYDTSQPTPRAEMASLETKCLGFFVSRDLSAFAASEKGEIFPSRLISRHSRETANSVPQRLKMDKVISAATFSASGVAPNQLEYYCGNKAADNVFRENVTKKFTLNCMHSPKTYLRNKATRLGECQWISV